jgi:hypothetical protein
LALEAGQTGQSESFAPFADDLTWRIEASGDEVIGETFGRHENDPGPDNVTIR